MSFNIGLVGATGIVGEEFIKILEQRDFPLKSFHPFASDQSVGKKIKCQNKEWTINSLSPECFKGLDYVFFSSGDSISKEWAPIAVKSGAYAIDNSAAFRLNNDTLLVVPEVNGQLLKSLKNPAIIANPNCSTIQLVMALFPLNRDFGINRVIVSSYQSVSGAGRDGKKELLENTSKKLTNFEYINPQVFTKEISFNCIPQIGSFNEFGFSVEEMKIMQESRKILSKNDLSISAMTVRVPTLNSHGESVWVDLDKNIKMEQFLDSLNSMGECLKIYSPSESDFPTPDSTSGSDPVHVGRIHKDLYNPQTWVFWVVADNLRVGAALNGIRIVENLIKNKS